MPDDERHYNINKLNVLFAVSSVALLLALGWLFMDDYSRTWKEHQRDFRAFEVEKTRLKYDGALRQIEKTPEYQALVERLKKIKKEYDANCSEVSGDQKRFEELRAENELLIQDKKFTIAKLDAARYRYESDGAHHGSTLEASRKEFEYLTERVAELSLAVETSDRTLNETSALNEACGDQLRDVKREEHAFLKTLKVLETKLSKIDPNEMDLTNRIAALRQVQVPPPDLNRFDQLLGQGEHTHA